MKTPKTDEEFLQEFAPTWQDWVQIPCPQNKWLVRDWVLAGGFIVLSGQMKRAGKSLLAMQLAHVVAEGVRNEQYVCHKQGNVVYILGEMPHHEVRDRILAITRGFGTEEPSKNVYFSYMKGISIDDKDSLAQMDRLLGITNPVLIILDTYFYLHNCDENDNKEVKKIIDVVQGWQQAGCAVMLLSHLNKGKGDDPMFAVSSQIRGAGALAGAMDLHIAARKYSDSKDVAPEIIFEGRGATQEPGKIIWTFEERDRDIGDGLLERYPYRISSEFLTKTGELRKMEEESMEYVMELRPDIRYTVGELASCWGVSEEESKRIRSVLTKLKLLRRSGTGTYVMSELGEAKRELRMNKK